MTQMELMNVINIKIMVSILYIPVDKHIFASYVIAPTSWKHKFQQYWSHLL